MSENTTDSLIADIELLRVHLDVERWLVLGGSWGSALALAYAERFPTRVRALILFGVTRGSCRNGSAALAGDESMAKAHSGQGIRHERA